MSRPRLALPISFLTLTLLPLAPTLTRACADGFEVVESKSSFSSQGKTIAVDRYEPKGDGPFPAVLVIHGAGGLTIGGAAYRESARTLAERGYVAHVVHYFDLTGTLVADRPTMTKNFRPWMKAIADGISSTIRQPNVDPKRVGLLGYSLGSYLSLSLSMFDPRVDAVVEYFGGIPEVLVKEVKTLPPVLILHGDADKIVPVSEAKALETLFKDKKVAFEMRIYPGQGHGFLGADASDARKRAMSFFEVHVKNADPTQQTQFRADPKGVAASIGAY